jgi:hypothetical protein
MKVRLHALHIILSCIYDSFSGVWKLLLMLEFLSVSFTAQFEMQLYFMRVYSITYAKTRIVNVYFYTIEFIRYLHTISIDIFYGMHYIVWSSVDKRM